METDQILIESFIASHTPEAVSLIEKMDYDETAILLKELPFQLATRVLSQMNSYRAAKALEKMELEFAAKLCEKMDLLFVELLIRQFDQTYREQLLNKLSSEKAERIRLKLRYSSDTVGALMNSKVYFLLKDKSVQEAEAIIKKSKELTTSEIYVTDREGKLAGILRLHELLLAKATEKISTIMVQDVPKFLVEESIEPVIKSLVWIDYKAVPVVDKSGLLIGSLQFDDIRKYSMKTDQEYNKQIIETGSALGELYRIGLTALLQSTVKFDS